MSNVTPDFVQEVLLDDLISAMQKGNYVSAASGARNILQLGQRIRLRSEVLSVANRTVNVLEDKGYSEKRFLQEMAGLVVQAEQCPKDAVQIAPDGSCPPGYFPLFADLSDKSTRRCCGKMQREWLKMDQEVREMAGQLTETSDKIAFEKRFLIQDATVQQARDEMVGIGITPHIAHFMERHKHSEKERIERKIVDIEQNKVSVKEVFGEAMTDSLYRKLKGLSGSAAALALWFVNHDWTYWWIGIYIFRFVALFGCMYLRVAEVTNNFYDYMQEVVDQWWGLKATKKYIRRSLMPNIMAVLLGSGFLSVASHGMIQFGGWIMSVLGTISLTGRLISLFSQAGFVMDLYFVLQDVWTFVKAAGMEMGSQVMSGNLNPISVVAAGLYKGTELYCDQTLRTFFTLAANVVGQTTKQFFVQMCEAISYILGKVAGDALSKFIGLFNRIGEVAGTGTVCERFSWLMDQVMVWAGQAAESKDETFFQAMDRLASVGGGMSSQDLVGRRIGPMFGPQNRA